LGHIHESVIVDYLKGFLDIATAVHPAVGGDLLVGLHTEDGLNGPIGLGLANVRRLFLLKQSRAVSFPKWTEAPDWWSDGMDRVMFNLSASYGFLHFSEFVKLFPKGGEQLNESAIRDWVLKVLTPRMEKAENI
jgi:hypothetical protein